MQRFATNKKCATGLIDVRRLRRCPDRHLPACGVSRTYLYLYHIYTDLGQREKPRDTIRESKERGIEAVAGWNVTEGDVRAIDFWP
jgi:hypothetical protein